jgi:hypothetical protein
LKLYVVGLQPKKPAEAIPVHVADVPAVCADPTEHDNVYVDTQPPPPMPMKPRQLLVVHWEPLHQPEAPSPTLR